MSSDTASGPPACVRTRTGDVVADYIADRLDEDEAEAFEAHYFQCDTCWETLRTALAARGALASEGTRASAGGRERPWHRRPVWRWIPAAAAVAALGLALSVWSPFGPRGAGEDVFRGGDVGIEPAVELTGPGLRVDWPDVPGTARYLVQVFDPEGALLLETETERPELSVPRARLPAERPATGWLLRVQALDRFGQVRATSGLVEVVVEDPR